MFYRTGRGNRKGIRPVKSPDSTVPEIFLLWNPANLEQPLEEDITETKKNESSLCNNCYFWKWSYQSLQLLQKKFILFAVCNLSSFYVCFLSQEPIENATPATVKATRSVSAHPPSSAFRNVSYQRATHDSLMGDTVVNHSPPDDASTRQDTAVTLPPPTKDASENDKTTTESSEVRRLTACFDRCWFYWQAVDILLFT